MRIVLLAGLCSLLSLSLNAQLNGNYTIGGTSPNYPTITDAVDDLMNLGVNGPVTFLLRPGTYAEGIDLYNPVSGLSSVNTVTFESEAGDSTSVTLNAGSSNALILSEQRYLIFQDLSFYSTSSEIAYLYDCPYIQFRRVSFNGDPGETGYGLYLDGDCSELQVEEVQVAGTGDYSVYGESYAASSAVSITQSVFSGGAGIYLYGFQAPLIQQNEISPSLDYQYAAYFSDCPGISFSDNQVGLSQEGQVGMYFYESNSGTVSANTLTVNSDYATGIELDYGCDDSVLSGNSLNIDGMGVSGINLYTGNVTLSGNQILFQNREADYGIYIDAYNGPVQLTANRITGLTAGTGLYISSLYGSGNGSSLIANNFIQGAGANGIYLSGGENINILHNSINHTTSDSYTAALYYSFGSNIRIANNILAATGGGYAFYSEGDESNLSFCDYNNLYTSGSNLVSFNYSDYADLAAWQGGGIYGQHSLSLDPLFTSTTDLHTAQAGLNAAALPGEGIGTDIDGEARSPSPDIGADEFGIAGLDAAITLVSPELPLAPATLPFTINLVNTASDALTAVTITWSVNGQAQTPMNWTGDLGEDEFEELLLGNYTFSAGEVYDLVIEITDVNGGATQLTTANDIIQIDGVQTAMAGYYTIGGTDPDFASITDAVDALYEIGVAGEVIFLLRSGTYDEQIYFEGPVAGVGPDRTITFRSEAMDASAVQITSDNYPVYLAQFGYLNLAYLSFVSQEEYNSVVYSQGAYDLNFDHCRLTGAAGSGSDIVYLGSAGNKLSFEACTFENGYQGLAIFPAGTLEELRVTDNHFSEVETAIYASSTLFSPVITGNELFASGYYGIVLYSPEGTPIIRNNRIIFSPASGGSAIYLDYTEGGTIANNFITINGNSGGQGIYCYDCSGLKILHNSIKVASGGSSTAAIYLDYGSGNQVVNNIAANFAGGLALIDRYGNHTYNYNDLYSRGAALVDRNYNSLSDLAGWQAASGQAANSISTNPLFVSDTDLHAQAPALDGAGKAGVGIGTDIDGEAREVNAPDIGADEFQRYPQDVAMIRMSGPVPPVDPAVQPVVVELINLGTESLTSVTINWSVNANPQTALTWSGNLAEGAGMEVTLGTFDFSSGGTFTIEATAYNPNELPDQHPDNNTLQASVETALIGIYTVGGSAADFMDIAAAVGALERRGAAGAVTFSLLPGTYEEQISIGDFPGNDLYSLHFRSQSLDYQSVTWQYVPTSPANYVLEVNGVRELTVEGIHLKALSGGSSYGTVISLQAGNRLNLTNNWLEGHPGGSSEFRKAIISHSNTFFDKLTLQGNLIDQGSYGLYNYNPSAQPGSQTVIGNNTFQNQYAALLISYMTDVQITENTFTVSHGGNYLGARVSNGQIVTVSENQFQGAGQGQAVYLGYISSNAAVSKNKIFGFGSGVELQQVGSGSIVNNFIQVGNNNTNAYGIRGGNGNLSILHNSVLNVSSQQSINSAALNLYSGGNHQIKNNILASTGGALVLNLASSGSYDSDHNDLYGTGNIWGIWNNNFRYNLAEWQAASGLDLNSISEAPQFAGAADLHLAQAALNAAGTPVGISDDIDGDPRDPVSPDIGADEFPYASDDILPVELVSATGLCADPEFYLQVEIENQGADAAGGFDLQIQEGALTLIEENVGAFSIPAGESAVYTFQTALDLSAAGTRQLKIISLLENDGNPDNNELAFELEIWALPTATAANDGPLCTGETLQLSAGGGTAYEWSGPEGFASNSQNPEIPNVSALQAGIYEVTVTNANACEATSSTEVVVHALPVVTAANDGPVCTGGNLQLSADGGESYQWTGPDGFTSNLSMPLLEQVQPGMAGSYAVTVTDANGCRESGSTEVIVRQVNGSISQNGPLCEGETLQLQAGGGMTYQWSGPDGFSSDQADPVIEAVSGAQAGLYELTITAENGCEQQLSTSLIVHELPTAGIVAETTMVCGGLPVGLTASGGQTYAWSVGEAGSEITVSPLSSTTYTVTVTDLNGCRDEASVTIEVENSAPYFEFTGNEGFTDAVVSPLQGSPYQSFRFEVDYYDADGDLPGASFPRLLLDYNNNGSYSDESDRIFVMTESDASDTDVTDGKSYFYQATGLPTSTQYRTAFLAQDAAGCSSQPFAPRDEPNVVDFADISIFANDITFSNNNPDPGTPLDVSARIHNRSDFPANNFIVRMVNQYNNTIYPDINVVELPPHSSTTVSWTITTPEEVSWNPLQVFIDHTNVIDEPNELDNQAIRPFINGAYNLPGTILVDPMASPEVSVAGSSKITVSGSAIYDGTAVPLSDPSVAGATVSFTLNETGQSFSTYTNSKGDFAYAFDPPLTPGLYHISGTVTDYTLTGTFSTEFVIQPAPCKPDLRCTVEMEAGSVIVGSSLNGRIEVVNSGCATSATSSLLDVSGYLGTPLPADVVIPALEPGESFLYEFPAPVHFNTVGTAGIQAIPDASLVVVESNEQNNTCAAAISVKPDLPDIRIAYISGGGQRYRCRENDFTIRLENIGGVSTGAFQVERVIRRMADGVVEYSDVVTINNIGSGGYVYSSLPHSFAQTGTYRVEVYADIPTAPQNGIVAELNEANNTAAIELALIECLPDLTLGGSLTVSPVDPHGSPTVNLTAQLKNNGNAPVSEDIVVRFRIGGHPVDVVHSGGLEVGQSVPVTAELPSPGMACAEVLITADATELITEVSEANNTQLSPLTYDFYLGNYCSFTAKKFWQRPHRVNQPVDFRVGLYNTGFFTASEVEVRFEISGPGISGWLDWGTSSLHNVGKTFSCPYVIEAATAYVFSQTGTYQVRMTVDPAGYYTECNEGNNVLQVPVTVVEDRPDLRILSQHIAPSKLNPDVGEPIQLDITYENIGQSNIGDEFQLRWEVNELIQDEITATGLNTGDHQTLSMPSTWSSDIPGIHILRATIDSREEILESDEANNEATRAILVGQYPNLYFDQVAVSDTDPVMGDQVEFDFDIVNAGDLACAADVQLFYVNDFGDTILFETFAVQIPANSDASFDRSWQVTDPATTILFRIVNADPEEYDLTDNEYSLQLGQLAVSAAATGLEHCPGSADGTAVVSVTGGQPPYLIQWSDGTAGAVLTAGAGTYELTVTDQSGHSATAAVTIETEIDAALPLIFNGPGDITRTITDGNCPVTVHWEAPEATDNCTLISLESDHEPGDTFQPGVTTVTYTAKDQAGNTRTYSFDVIINAQPLALAGTDQLICGPATSLGAVVPEFGTGQWSVLEGNAVFADAGDPASAVSDLAPGLNRLQWEVANGSCGSALDEVLIISDPAAYEFDGAHFAPPIPADPGAVLSANWEITDEEGWTHYYQCAEDGGSGYLLLSIYKDGQNIGQLGQDLEVKNITVPTYGTNQAHDLSGADYVETEGWYVFGRYWDVETAMEPEEPVLIRYYYSPADTLALKQTIEMNGGHWDDDEAMRFFKVSGTGVGPFDLNVLAAGGAYLEYENGSTPSLDTWAKGDFQGLMYAEYYVSSFSGGGGGGSPGPEGLRGALPLDLLSFSAERMENGTVRLDWVTINEFAVAGFQVQRSGKGTEWEDIGWRDSQGDNIEKQFYQWSDAAAPSTTLYYRLEMLDLDGTITYSPIVSVSGGILTGTFKLYPNPTSGTFHLSVPKEVPADEEIRIRISDGMGRLLMDRPIKVSTASTRVTINALEQQPAGIYTLMIFRDGVMDRVMRVIKE